MDGVPGVSFAGIKPGETFIYRFPVLQSGTYWYHSHSGGQELLGMYGALIIDPLEPEPFRYDSEHVVVLSDWSFDDPMAIVAKLKSDAGYYNFQKRDLGDLVSDVSKMGVLGMLSDRLKWGRMSMDPTDMADVTGYAYTYLMNGFAPSDNWTALFRKGERVRLRFVAAGAMTLFDVRIPGLKMTVVQADGQNVQPVTVEEFRIAPGETYDVIVEPSEEKAYAIFAETTDRSGYALGALAPRAGMLASLPERRERPIRGMADMGMAMTGMKGMAGMKSGMDNGAENAMPEMKTPKTSESKASAMQDMPGMETPSIASRGGEKKGSRGGQATSPIPGSTPVKHGPDQHGMGNSFVPEESRSRLHEPGTGLEKAGRRVLVYTDLRSLAPGDDQRAPARDIELHLTGNMERYIWSIDGKKYSESPSPILFHYGERLRLTFVNDTMMEHPMHLHGMWMYLENGTGDFLPRKHTVMVKPAERLSVAITADAPGRWAFHCHLLLHMEMGMFRVVEVTPKKTEADS